MEGKMTIKHRLGAIAFLGVIIGVAIAMPDLQPQPKIQVISWWERMEIIGIFTVTLLLGYEAGKEREKYKDI